jgi:hypothetical protein
LGRPGPDAQRCHFQECHMANILTTAAPTHSQGC